MRITVLCRMTRVDRIRDLERKALLMASKLQELTWELKGIIEGLRLLKR